MLDRTTIKNWNSLKFGLVLSGGGAKGAYEAGAIYALHELDIFDKIKVISGTSIGALNAIAAAMNDANLIVKIWDDIGYRDVIGVSSQNKKDTLMDAIKYIADNRKSMSLSEIASELKTDLSDIEMNTFNQSRIRALIDKYFDINVMRASQMDLYACAYNREKHVPKFFNLKRLTDENVYNAVLASCAIPHLYPPVSIYGEMYSDGGINDPEYPIANAVNTPVEPMNKYELDAVIIIYLSDEPKLVSPERYTGNIISIVPSQSLEAVKFSGTMNFTQQAIQSKRELGYRDTLAYLAPAIIRFMKGDIKKIGTTSLIKL